MNILISIYLAQQIVPFVEAAKGAGLLKKGLKSFPQGLRFIHQINCNTNCSHSASNERLGRICCALLYQ
jgi:hypothetical protein